MVDDQAVIVFLRQLDRMLSEALRSDEQQRVRRLTLTQTLVMAALAHPLAVRAARKGGGSRGVVDCSGPGRW
jgi:hypothetical protein